jgi:hypothetical protein
MGKTLMDGTEQVMFESTELGEYSGYVFLEALRSGDTVVIREYIKDVEDDVYRLFETHTYSNVQDLPAIRIVPIIGKVGIKITIQQTAGVYREVTHMWFKR